MEISVVVITYNHENYIRQCIDSILAQKIDVPYELLISDDASMDHTPEILKQYQKKYPDIIKLTLRTENVGATRNSYDLLLQAKGRYIANCEGDDYWCDDNKLQIQYDFMEKHSEFIGCSHDVCLVDRNGVQKKQQKLYWIGEQEIFRLRDFKGIFLPGHISTLFRRNIYNAGTDYSIMYQAHRNIGDRTSALYYLALGDFYKIPRVMSCYRQIAEEKGSNLSSKLYLSTSESVRRDFRYTLKLEEYAKKAITQKVDFDYHKCELLLRMLNGRIHTKKDLVLLFDIYQSMKHKARIFYLPWSIGKRKMKGRLLCR